MNIVFAQVRRLYPAEGIIIAQTAMGRTLQLAPNCEGADGLAEGVHAAFVCSQHVPAVSPAGVVKSDPLAIEVIVNPTGQTLYDLMKVLKH